MQINSNGHITSVIETDQSNTYISSSVVWKLEAIIGSPKEGGYLAFKDGHLQWLPIPPSFKNYTDKL